MTHSATKHDIKAIFDRFEAARSNPKGELNWSNPYTLLVAVALSAQATDVSVNKATEALFPLAATPQDMLVLGEERLLDMIRSIGLYRTKARHIIKTAAILVDQHDGIVPPHRDILETFPGIGRKTANVVLSIAFGHATIAVDTHVFRVSRRLGLAVGTTVRAVEDELMETIPEEYRVHAHHWLILHGRYLCKARRPLCDRCFLADLCRWPDKTQGESIEAKSS